MLENSSPNSTSNDKNNKVLSKYAEIINSDSFPNPRFGHTVNLVSKSTILIFGGAISTQEIIK